MALVHLRLKDCGSWGWNGGRNNEGGGRGHGSVAEYLPSMHKTLSWIPSSWGFLGRYKETKVYHEEIVKTLMRVIIFFMVNLPVQEHSSLFHQSRSPIGDSNPRMRIPHLPHLLKP